MAEVVYANDRHEHVLRKLLDEVNATMSIYHVWGSHLGSAHLFRQHLDSRRRITEIVEKTQVSRLTMYRVTIHVVSNLQLTPHQRLCLVHLPHTKMERLF